MNLPDPEYWAFHERRFRFLVERALASVSTLGQARILVIGPSYETLLLAEALPQATIDTLGYEDVRYRTPCGVHHAADLNNEHLPDLTPYDLVVAAEVIEHLWLPPRVFFARTQRWLGPAGRMLIQTPNAASLAKRLRLLRGFNPYMLPPDPMDHSFHVREYTATELMEAAGSAGLRTIRVDIQNYFAHSGTRGRLYLAISRFSPASSRDGITLEVSR